MNRIFLSESILKGFKNESITEIVKKLANYDSITTLDKFASEFLDLMLEGNFDLMKDKICS